MNEQVPIKVSARHIHLSAQDLTKLFGADFELSKDKDVDQPGQFSAKERLTISGPKEAIENVAIVAPLREKTQVEISKTDAYRLGIDPPIKESVSSPGTEAAKITIIGPVGEINIKAAIISQRHIHLNSNQAEQRSLKNGQLVSVQVDGKRALEYRNVLVRINDEYDLSMHVDTDEANAGNIVKEGQGLIVYDKD